VRARKEGGVYPCGVFTKGRIAAKMGIECLMYNKDKSY
jgi:hypothetical protein